MKILSTLHNRFSMIETSKTDAEISERQLERFRKTLQPLMPQQLSGGEAKKGEYSLYPYHSMETNKIFYGYSSLAQWILSHDKVIIDGYSGVLWDDVYTCLEEAFQNVGA